MKFGESFVFPDPDSRLSHKPLKMVTVQSKPLVQNDTMYSTFCQKVTEEKPWRATNLVPGREEPC